MTANSTSSEVEVRRRPARAKDKGVVDLAGDALKEIATLHSDRTATAARRDFRKADIYCDVRGADRCRRAFADGDDRTVARSRYRRPGCLWSFLAGRDSHHRRSTLCLAGAGLVWVGFNRLSMARLAPSKTLDQLQKDSNITNMR